MKHRLQACLAAEVSLAPGEVVAEDEEGEGGVLGPEVGHRLQVERLVEQLRQPELAELVVVCPPGGGGVIGGVAATLVLEKVPSEGS